MRFLLLTVLMLAGCSNAGDSDDSLVGIYHGQDRDALCIAREGEGLKAGLIAYGDGDMNCSFSGRAQISGNSLVLTPRGDSECSVEIDIANGIATLGQRAAACAYYCGPGANFGGRKLLKTPEASAKVSDFAGDPIC
jgi:hypothetical protein